MNFLNVDVIIELNHSFHPPALKISFLGHCKALMTPLYLLQAPTSLLNPLRNWQSSGEDPQSHLEAPWDPTLNPTLNLRPPGAKLLSE